MTEKIKKIKQQLIKIDQQRSLWIYSSLLFLIFITSVMFYWKDLWNLEGNQGVYLLLPIALPVLAGWWYWTMNILGKLLQYKNEEISILEGISLEIKELKKKLPKI